VHQIPEYAPRGAELSGAVDNVIPNQLSEVSGLLRLLAPSITALRAAD
jgi:hypothetical protein